MTGAAGSTGSGGMTGAAGSTATGAAGASGPTGGGGAPGTTGGSGVAGSSGGGSAGEPGASGSAGGTSTSGAAGSSTTHGGSGNIIGSGCDLSAASSGRSAMPIWILTALLSFASRRRRRKHATTPRAVRAALPTIAADNYYLPEIVARYFQFRTTISTAGRALTVVRISVFVGSWTTLALRSRNSSTGSSSLIVSGVVR